MFQPGEEVSDAAPISWIQSTGPVFHRPHHPNTRQEETISCATLTCWNPVIPQRALLLIPSTALLMTGQWTVCCQWLDGQIQSPSHPICPPLLVQIWSIWLTLTCHGSLIILSRRLSSTTTLMPRDINPLSSMHMGWFPVHEEVHYLVEHGFAVPSTSAWSCPSVLVPKPDSTPRLLNKCGYQTRFVSSKDGSIDTVGSAKFIPKLDLLKGY